MSNVIALPSREPRASMKLRAGVPSFDPTNAAHLRAWEAIWSIGERDSAPGAILHTGGQAHD